MLGFDIKISKDTTTKLRTDFDIGKKIELVHTMTSKFFY